MLQLLGNLFLKFDAFVDGAFEFIVPKKPSDDKRGQDSINNKKMKLERKNDRQIQENVDANRLSGGLNSQNDKERQKRAIRYRKLRSKLNVSMNTVREIEDEHFEGLISSISSRQTSFLLPLLISFTDKYWLNQSSIYIAYKHIAIHLKQGKIVEKDQQIVEVKSLQQETEQTFIPILKGKIKIYTKYLDINVEEIPQFVKMLEEELSNLMIAIQDDNKSCSLMQELKKGEIQYILKMLRKAKIYRYQLNEQLHGLIGRYLFLRSSQVAQEREEEQKVIEEFQLTDIGMLDESIKVSKREEKQIIKFWKKRIQCPYYSIHSRFNRYEQKIIRQLNIKSQYIDNVETYYQVLKRFQQRIIVVEEERSRNEIVSKKQELTQAYDNFLKAYSLSHAVRDKVWTGVMRDFPVPSFQNSTCLRLFKKWRSFDCTDNLSGSKIVQRLISRRLKLYDALELLLNDYNLQLLIPRNRYISSLIDTIQYYKQLLDSLICEQQSYRKIKELMTNEQKDDEQEQDAGIYRQQQKIDEDNSNDMYQSIDEPQEQQQSSSSSESSDESEGIDVQMLSSSQVQFDSDEEGIDSDSSQVQIVAHSQLQKREGVRQDNRQTRQIELIDQIQIQE